MTKINRLSIDREGLTYLFSGMIIDLQYCTYTPTQMHYCTNNAAIIRLLC